jgi:hypothetical protein
LKLVDRKDASHITFLASTAHADTSGAGGAKGSIRTLLAERLNGEIAITAVYLIWALLLKSVPEPKTYGFCSTAKSTFRERLPVCVSARRISGRG